MNRSIVSKSCRGWQRLGTIAVTAALAGLGDAKGEIVVERAADLNAGSEGSYPSNFVSWNGALYFSAYEPDHGRELWRHLGGGGAARVADINDTVRDIGFGITVGNDSVPTGMTPHRGELYFSAYDPRRGGELWRTDGTNTARLSDINPDQNDAIKTNAASAWPKELTVLDDVLYFAADGGGGHVGSNYELWRYNGTNVSLAANLHADTGASYSSYPQGLTAFAGALYFTADDGTNGYELWKYTAASGAKLLNINPGGPASGSYPKFFTPFNGALYFQAYRDTDGFELWKTDGATSTRVADLVPGAGSSFPEYLTVYAGSLYFRATGPAGGSELWRYDGTNAPTLAADVNPTGDSHPKNLFVFQDKLYFAATDGIRGWELWVYDGTAATLVSDLNPDGDSYPEQLTSNQGSLYFVATTPATGYEVWRYDGTRVAQATDINPGAGDAYPQGLTVVGRELCFSARSDNYVDWELWTLRETGGGSGVLDVVPSIAQTFLGHAGGPFFPTQRFWTLTNSGTAPLDWSVAEVPLWLTLEPASGHLEPLASTTVVMRPGSGANGLPVGSLPGSVAFAHAAGGETSRAIRIDVYDRPAFFGPPAVVGARLHATLRGIPDWHYAVEATPDFGGWTRIGTNQADALGILHLDVPMTTSPPWKFIRAVAAP